jgi:hypothetical protein
MQTISLSVVWTDLFYFRQVPASKKPKIVSPPREVTVKTVEDRIRSNSKLMERFPREGDFEVLNPKTVRCSICKKNIHLASEGTTLPNIVMPIVNEVFQ